MVATQSSVRIRAQRSFMNFVQCGVTTRGAGPGLCIEFSLETMLIVTTMVRLDSRLTIR